MRIRVYFELESRTRWAPHDGAPMDDFWVDLECTREALKAAAVDLRQQRDEFPPRAGVTTTRYKPDASGSSARAAAVQPIVSKLLRGRLHGSSLERLARFLNVLDRDVEIVVRRRPRSREHGQTRVRVAG